MNVEEALTALRAHADPGKADGMAAYHKADRDYLGLSNAVTGDLATTWRKACPDAGALTALAEGLWKTDIFEARIAAAKLFLQARMRPDDATAWDWISAKVPDLDSWAIADALAQGGQKRLLQNPSRLDTLDRWITSDHLWTRRAAFTFTLGFLKSRHPNATEQAARTRVLNWAETLAEDPEWFIQKTIAWWLRDLSKRDQDAARGWLEQHGSRLKPFAAKEAARYLP